MIGTRWSRWWWTIFGCKDCLFTHLRLQLLRHGRIRRRPPLLLLLLVPLVAAASPLTVGPRAEVTGQLRPQRRLPGAQRVEPRQAATTGLLLMLLPRRGRR